MKQVFRLFFLILFPVTGLPLLMQSQDVPSAEPVWEYIGHQGLYTRHNGAYSGDIGQGWINRIWVDPDNHDVILAGSHNSGIWKTTDGGNNWYTISDNCPGMKGIKSMEIHPSDHQKIFVATCTLDRYSTGLYYSSDGGQSWDQNRVLIGRSGKYLFPTANKREFPVKWLIHPYDSTIMYLATWTQVLVSADGGITWEIILNKPEYNVFAWGQGIKDMEFDLSDHSTVFVTGIEIHRITGDGSKVTEMDGLIPESVRATGKVLRIVAGTQTAFPDKIWFNIYTLANKRGHLSLVRHNTVTGEIIVLASTGVSPGTEHKMQCEVSPLNEGRIVLGGVTALFYDAGNKPSFYIISTSKAPKNWIHVDVRDLCYLADTSGREKLFVACDGSVFIGEEAAPGKPWRWTYIGDDGANGIHNSELKGFDCSNTPDDVMYAGFQDMNGAVYDNGTWYNILAGDGSSGVVDGQNPDYIYASYYGNRAIVRKSNNRGASFNHVITVDNKIPAMMLMPSNPDVLLIGGRGKLYCFDSIRSSNQYRILYEVESDPDTVPEGYHIAGNLDISATDVSQSDEHIIYFSTKRHFPAWAKNIRRKALYKTVDGGRSWVDLSDAATGDGPAALADALKRGPVSGIAIHPEDPEEVWICIAGNSFRNEAPPVFYTSDGGSTWQPLSEGLDFSFPANDIAFNPSSGALYVATDNGIYCLDRQNHRWITVSGNLPPAVINKIRFNQALNKIRISTYGRGIWQSDIPY